MSVRALHLRAYQRRAGIVGELMSCICTYPLEEFSTDTKHDENCPAHHMIAARLSTRELAGALSAVRAKVSP